MYVKTAFTLLDFLFKWTREQKASKNTICEPVMSKIIDEYGKCLTFVNLNQYFFRFSNTIF